MCAIGRERETEEHTVLPGNEDEIFGAIWREHSIGILQVLRTTENAGCPVQYPTDVETAALVERGFAPNAVEPALLPVGLGYEEVCFHPIS
jgi:hypothetical protein